jgi:hypothetical protein
VDKGGRDGLTARPPSNSAQAGLSPPGRRVEMIAHRVLFAGTAIAEQFVPLHCSIATPRAHDEAVYADLGENHDLGGPATADEGIEPPARGLCPKPPGYLEPADDKVSLAPRYRRGRR